MSKRQELLRRIEALELSKTLIEDKITKAKASLELIEDEITLAKASLKQIEHKIDSIWQENPYVQDRTTKRLAEYFRTLGYSIVSLLTKAPDKDPRYAISKQIWNGKSIMLPFLNYLHQSGSKEFEYSIGELSGTDKTDLLNLCKNMQDSEWIEYSKVKDVLHVKAFHKKLKNFECGGWAEEANRYLIQKVLIDYSNEHKNRFKYRVFWDVKLKLLDSEKDNLNDMQLDIIAQINDRFYVFETKTGVLGIQKWVERAEIFNQDGNRFLTCCIDSSVNPKLFQPYCLLSLEKLEKQLVELLDDDFSPAKS